MVTEKLSSHDREITLLSQAVTRLEAIMESDQEIKRDMKTEMKRNAEQTSKLIEAITEMRGVRAEVRDLKEARDNCMVTGCPTAQRAEKRADRAMTLIWGFVSAIAAVVVLGIIGSFISGKT